MRDGRFASLRPGHRAHALLCLCVLLCGCASTAQQMAESKPVPYDPFERFNRGMYAVNTTVDKYTLKPLAKGYKKIMPTPVRRGFANIFSNFTTPRSALNNFLQSRDLCHHRPLRVRPIRRFAAVRYRRRRWHATLR